MARKKREQFMGRAAISFGLFLKILQIIFGAQLGFSAFSSVFMTTATTAFLVGGFCVLAVECMNITSLFSAACAASVLFSVFFSGEALYALIYLAASFASFAFMLISMRKKYRILAGICVICLAVLPILHSFSLISLPGGIITLILSALYLTEGIGLFL